MRRFRRDDDLHRRIDIHHARHAGGEAQVVAIEPRPAGFLVGNARLQDALVFGRERRLLGETLELVWIEGRIGRGLGAQGLQPGPLALPVGIFRFIERLSAATSNQHRCRKNDRSDRASVQHEGIPVNLHKPHGRRNGSRRSRNREDRFPGGQDSELAGIGQGVADRLPTGLNAQRLAPGQAWQRSKRPLRSSRTEMIGATEHC